MVYLKMAWRAMKRSRLANLLTVLQLAAALLVTAVMVSAVGLRFRRYTPFKEFFSGQGQYVCYSLGLPYVNSIFDENMNFCPIETAEQFSRELSAEVETVGIHENLLGPHLEKEAGVNAETTVQQYACDDAIIAAYTPDIAEGRWLRPSQREAVISYNDTEHQVGDTIQVSVYYYLDSNLECNEIAFLRAEEFRIVGRLANGAYIPGISGVNTEDFRTWYRSWSSETEESPLMLFSYEALKALDNTHKLLMPYMGAVLMRYPERISQEQLLADQKLLAIGAAWVWDLEELDVNSRAYLYTEVYKLLPIIVMLMMLVTISSISSTAISTRKRLRDYAVFSLSGLPWGKCIVINLVQSLMTAGGAALLAAVGAVVLRLTALRETFYVSFGIKQMLICGALILLYLAVSLLMPWVMLRKNSVREILKTQ